MLRQKTILSFFKPESKAEEADVADSKLKEAYTPAKVSNIHKGAKRAFMMFENKKSYDKTHQWNNYLFIATNNFTEYKVTNTIPMASKQSKEVFPSGTTIATATVDDDSALTNIEVNAKIRRQGIGTELIRFIKNACPQFVVFGGSEHNSRYRLTHEGAALIEHCRRKKILKAEQVIVDFVPESPLVRYES